jgi:hypothetical protein
MLLSSKFKVKQDRYFGDEDKKQQKKRLTAKTPNHEAGVPLRANVNRRKRELNENAGG